MCAPFAFDVPCLLALAYFGEVWHKPLLICKWLTQPPRGYLVCTMQCVQAQQLVKELEAAIATNKAARLSQLQDHWQQHRSEMNFISHEGDAYASRERTASNRVELRRVESSYTSSHGKSRCRSRSHMPSAMVPSPMPSAQLTLLAQDDVGDSKNLRRSHDFLAQTTPQSSSSDNTVAGKLEDKFSKAILDANVSSPPTPRTSTPARKKLAKSKSLNAPTSPQTPEKAADNVVDRLLRSYTGKCTKEEVQQALADTEGHGGRAKKKLNELVRHRQLNSRSSPSGELVRGRSSLQRHAHRTDTSPTTRKSAQTDAKDGKLQTEELQLEPQVKPEPDLELDVDPKPKLEPSVQLVGRSSRMSAQIEVEEGIPTISQRR